MIHFLILKLKSISWLKSDRIYEKEGKWEKYFLEFYIPPNSINVIELVLFKQRWKAVYGCTFSFYGHEYHYALKQQREATQNKLFKCNFQLSTVRYVTGDSSKRSNLRNHEHTSKAIVYRWLTINLDFTTDLRIKYIQDCDFSLRETEGCLTSRLTGKIKVAESSGS